MNMDGGRSTPVMSHFWPLMSDFGSDKKSLQAFYKLVSCIYFCLYFWKFLTRGENNRFNSALEKYLIGYN